MATASRFWICTLPSSTSANAVTPSHTCRKHGLNNLKQPDLFSIQSRNTSSSAESTETRKPCAVVITCCSSINTPEKRLP